MRLHLSAYLSPQRAIRWILRCCPWPLWQVPQKTPRFPSWRISTPSAASNMFYLGKLNMARVFLNFVWSPRGPRWHLSRHKLLHFTSHFATFYWTSYLTYYLPCCFICHLIKHKFWHYICDIWPQTFSGILSDIYIYIYDQKQWYNMTKHNLAFF